MKLKFISVMIIISLLMVSSLGVSITAKEEIVTINNADNFIKSSSKEHTEILEQGKDVIPVSTTGPIAPILDITDITFLDGSFFKIVLINWIVENNFFTIRPNITININDMTFIIEYTRNVINRPLFHRFSYETIVGEEGNESIYTEKHTLIVSGFTGTFEFSRRKPLRLTPAHFSFEGICDNVIVST